MKSIKQNIIAYRGTLDRGGCTLTGRVLGRPLLGDPGELGLIELEEIAEVAKEVQRDRDRPEAAILPPK